MIIHVEIYLGFLNLGYIDSAKFLEVIISVTGVDACPGGQGPAGGGRGILPPPPLPLCTFPAPLGLLLFPQQFPGEDGQGPKSVPPAGQPPIPPSIFSTALPIQPNYLSETYGNDLAWL